MKILLPFFLSFPLFAQHSNTLTWQWSQGAGSPATGFHVRRATFPQGPFTTIATLTPDARIYVDNAVTAGQTNYYVVTAFNNTSAPTDSLPSNQVVAVTPSDPPQQWTISGSVQVVNATVRLSGSSFATVTSGLAGAYSFLQSNGTYTVTPSKWRCNFSPPSQTVTLNSASVVLNFQATGRHCRQ